MKINDIDFTQTERDDINEKIGCNLTFRKNIWEKKIDYTRIINEEIDYIINGKIPRNFVMAIKGGIGRQSGVFKTTLGIQLAFHFDKTFNIKERVGFTAEELGEKVKEYATEKQIFLLDEKVRELRKSPMMRLLNVIESCREKQLCFIIIGIPENVVTYSDYTLERLGESNDKYLPKKTVVYSVFKTINNSYRGYYKKELMPLTNPKWKKVWDEYMVLKRQHEQNAINNNISGFNFEELSKKLINDDEFSECIENEKLNIGTLKNVVFKFYPDFTHDERRMILAEVKRLFKKSSICGTKFKKPL